MNNEELYEQFEEALRKGFMNKVVPLLINLDYDRLDYVFKSYDMDLKQFIGEGLCYSGTRKEFYDCFILRKDVKFLGVYIAQYACDDIPNHIIEQTQDWMLKDLKPKQTEQLEDGSIF